MARKAGVITIDLNAGTAKFLVDMDKANAKVAQFGNATQGSMAKSTAALRGLEGNLANNNRAIARWLVETAKMGPVLQAAFPLIGGIAFGTMVVELGGKVAKFFRDMQSAPERANAAFREMNGSLVLTNDQLAISNARLENQLAKLQGHRENTVKVMLLEAKEASDKLAESLQKNLSALNKLMAENGINSLMGAVTGRAETRDLEKELGGEQGLGGFAGRIRDMLDKGAKPEVLAAAYKAEIEKIQAQFLNPALYQQGKYLARTGIFRAAVPPEMQGGYDRARSGQDTTYAADQSLLIEKARGAISNLGEQASFIGLEGQHGKLAGALPGAEQAAKDRETALRLENEIAEARGALLGVMEKIDAEQGKEIDRLKQEGQYTKDNADALQEAYDWKRLKTYNDEMERLGHSLAEIDNQWAKREAEFGAKPNPIIETQIEEGKKKLEEAGKALAKWSAEYNKVLSNADNQAMQHRIRMISIQYGSGDPTSVLSLEQDLRRQDIMDRYNNSLKAATSELERAAIIKQKNLELDTLDYEMQERIAAQHQKTVREFFLEMQHDAQTTGNILYNAMHSALDQVSGELAKLFTGQKTSFGKMLQGIGQEMEKSAIKSALQRGLGALGKKLGISLPEKPDGTQAKPFHVIVDNQQGGSKDYSPVSDTMKRAAGAAAPAVGGFLKGIGGFLGKVFAGGASGGGEAVSSSISYMADGGPMSPSETYITGEAGIEMFTKTSGYITRNAELRRMMGNSGGSPTYNIDARGADLGAGHRVAQAIEVSHAQAVRNSVRANSERAKRTPQRSK